MGSSKKERQLEALKRLLKPAAAVVFSFGRTAILLALRSTRNAQVQELPQPGTEYTKGQEGVQRVQMIGRKGGVQESWSIGF
jgi:hypothetical protein